MVADLISFDQFKAQRRRAPRRHCDPAKQSTPSLTEQLPGIVRVEIPVASPARSLGKVSRICDDRTLLIDYPAIVEGWLKRVGYRPLRDTNGLWVRRPTGTPDAA